MQVATSGTWCIVYLTVSYDVVLVTELLLSVIIRFILNKGRPGDTCLTLSFTGTTAVGHGVQSRTFRPLTHAPASRCPTSVHCVHPLCGLYPRLGRTCVVNELKAPSIAFPRGFKMLPCEQYSRNNYIL